MRPIMRARPAGWLARCIHSRPIKGDATCVKYRFVYKIPYRLVYKIPYRRARAWPSGCIGRVRARAKKSCIQQVSVTGDSREGKGAERR